MLLYYIKLKKNLITCLSLITFVLALNSYRNITKSSASIRSGLKFLFIRTETSINLF